MRTVGEYVLPGTVIEEADREEDIAAEDAVLAVYWPEEEDVEYRISQWPESEE